MAVEDWAVAISPFFMLGGLQMLPIRKNLSIQMIFGLGIFHNLPGLLWSPLYRSFDVKQYPE
ncbi:Integral membrane protein [Apiospora aurea]|uniref:Integral membrane protein n=1 Tax=Apiospora aurea TaxID=335848 RepID=A0ABR1PVB5_9PEZI